MASSGRLGMMAAVAFTVGASVAGEILELRSGDAILGLDGATGAPVRLADGRAGLQFAGGGQELFRLAVILPGGDPQKPLELSSREARAVTPAGGDGLTLRFEAIGGRGVKIGRAHV